VSGSSKKKARQELEAQGPTSRQQKRQEQERAERRTLRLYTVLGVLVAVLAVFLVVWQSGVIQRNTAAVTINGVKYGPADVQYYYNTVVNQSGLASYGADLDTIIMDQETGQTGREYFQEQAIDALVTAAALSDKAKAEGYEMSQEARDDLDAALESFNTNWRASGASNRDAYLRANLGPYVTFERLQALMEQQALASDYAAAQLDATEITEADEEAYYQEHKDALDSYTITQFVFQAKPEAAAEGEERTSEETAALLEEAKTQVKAKAEELKAKLEAGEDPEALAEAYKDDLYSSEISAVSGGETNNTYGISGINSSYADWAKDAARKNGDVTLAEYDGTTSYNYYVVRFEGRVRDDTRSNNIRHILFKGDDAQSKAQALLDQWKAGEATEDSFAALAQENSEDTGSAANGGLITNVSPTSNYVIPFRDWANDASRKEGDTGLVESDYGWHIMYYVPAEPVWRQIAEGALRSDAYIELRDAAREGYEAVRGAGMKFLL